ncbi:MAG: glycosyltransferase family 39 protein, partial [Patescibacteria group bacterium]|nr:glycosyltransferase family 39 protein [Patescibacteria group bacterium]
MKKIVFAVIPILIVLVLSLPIIRPLFAVGFFPMHDNTQVARVFEMGKALQDGMFPVRWVNDLGYGYGYPIFTFYAPLAYYIGGFISAAGTDPLLATKIMMGIGMLLSGVFMYLFCKEVFGKEGGILGGLFYTFATYHAVDLYVRGDVAEFFAYAFIPLAAYGILLATRKSKLATVFIGAIGVAGIIVSHNLTAFMTMPFLLVFASILAGISWKTTHSFRRMLFAFLPIVAGV